MADAVLGPWPVGMDNVSSPHALPRDQQGNARAVRLAVDCSITREGYVQHRPGFERVALPRAHSFYSGIGASYCVSDGQLVRVDGAGLTTPVCTLLRDERLTYTPLNGELIFCGPSQIRALGPAGVRELAPATPASPSVQVQAGGGLFGGRYGFAVSVVDAAGAESAVSAATFVEIPEGGGALLSGVPTGARVYRTQHDGDVFYRCASGVAGEVLIGSGEIGKQADTRHLDPMPAGEFVRAWRGRLLVAAGRNLYASEPLRYGLHSRRHGFITLPTRIRWIEPVEGGIFVGQVDGVRFLRGTAWGELSVEVTGAAPPLARASTRVQPALLGMDEQPNGECAVWLSPRGFVVGMPDGQVMEPQAQRIRLAGTRGEIAVNDRRIVAITQ
jgi:hypothetical protein